MSRRQDSDREHRLRKALELFERHRVFYALGVVAVLVVASILLRLLGEKESGAGAAGHALLVDLVTGLIPVFVVFVGSYFLYREYRNLQAKQRESELKDVVGNAVETSLEAIFEKRVRVSRDQPSDTEAFRELIRKVRPKEADLLEYSTAAIEDIIVELKQCGAKMRILVYDPRFAKQYQLEKVKQRLKHLRRLVLDSYEPGAEVCCYSQFPSVRGRLLDRRILNIGWYTPDLKNPDWEVLGHSNPLITTSVSTAEGEYLFRMFTGLFDLLWKQGTSAETVLAEIEAQPE